MFFSKKRNALRGGLLICGAGGVAWAFGEPSATACGAEWRVRKDGVLGAPEREWPRAARALVIMGRNSSSVSEPLWSLSSSLELRADRVGALPEGWHPVFEGAKLSLRKSAVLVFVEEFEDLLRAAARRGRTFLGEGSRGKERGEKNKVATHGRGVPICAESERGALR